MFAVDLGVASLPSVTHSRRTDYVWRFGGSVTDGDGTGWVLLGLGLFPLFILLLVWLISAGVAAAVAYHRGRSAWGFFAVTFFFLGPLGPGVALLAQREDEGVPVVATVSARSRPASGRRRFLCQRCGAENDVPNASKVYDCWRCNGHYAVKPVA